MGAVQAIQAAPDKGLPHVAACISMGRLAIFSDNKIKVLLLPAFAFFSASS